MSFQWICSNTPMSVLYWRPQNWIQNPRCDHTTAQQRGKITSFNLLALPFALQPKVGSWEHCLHMLNLLSSRSDISFSTYLLSRWSAPSLFWCMVQNLVSPLVKLTEFLVGPFLQPVKMPLSSSRPICRPSSCTNYSSVFCIVCRLAEGALPHRPVR